MKISGKVAVITGASGGIGYSMAKYLYKEGVKVYDISLSTEKHEEIAKSYSADVNDKKKINEILEEIYNENGHLDIFINNAGFGIAGAIEDASPEKIYALVNTNLSAVIALSGVAIKFLKRSKGGRIINTCSVGGIIPLPFQATYSATKAGVEIFGRALANEVKPFNIKVTSVLPGDTKTGFTQNRIVENNNQNDSYRKDVEKSIKKMEKDEITGKSPDTVGKMVVKLLKKRNPPLRKTIGFWYKCVVFLPRILPTKLINFLVDKIYC